MTIELVTTDGIFALDGGEWEVTNNIWLVGDDREVVVFDAAHDAAAIVDAIHGRRVTAIVLTHGHNDHINAAVPLRDAEVGLDHGDAVGDPVEERLEPRTRLLDLARARSETRSTPRYCCIPQIACCGTSCGPRRTRTAT